MVEPHQIGDSTAMLAILEYFTAFEAVNTREETRMPYNDFTR